MQTAIEIAAGLRRPKLLTQAARIRARSYCSKRDLPQELRGLAHRSNSLLMRLIELEAEHDGRRRTGLGHYDLPAHITILGCLLAEVAQ